MGHSFRALVDFNRRTVSLKFSKTIREEGSGTEKHKLEIDTCLSEAVKSSVDTSSTWFMVHPDDKATPNLYQIVSSARLKDTTCDKQFLTGKNEL